MKQPGTKHRDKWIEAIEKYQEFNHHSPYFSICELHFEMSSISNKNDRREAIPTIFPGYVQCVCTGIGRYADTFDI